MGGRDRRPIRRRPGDRRPRSSQRLDEAALPHSRGVDVGGWTDERDAPVAVGEEMPGGEPTGA